MDPSMFFHPLGPGSPGLIGPVGGDISGFPHPPPDPSMHFRFDIRGYQRVRDLHRQLALGKTSNKNWRRQKQSFARLRPRDKEIRTLEPLKVGDEHGKPASPRGLEHRDPFDALEYSSPRYLLEENRSPRKLPGHITGGKQIKEADEALEGLEGTFMMPLEPISAE